MSRSVRIGNGSGFYGDRFSAFEEMVDAGVDVVTGDYLAELTMLILARQKAKDPESGYARTFLSQLRRSLQKIVETDTRVVVNAGGMNPAGLARAVRDVAAEAGLDVTVAHVDGDDLTDRADGLGLGSPLAANAYLGGVGITEALSQGARVVVTGRVTDAALVTGTAAWFHGWKRDEYDKLAGAMAAGHVIECGMQATGGNYAFFQEIPSMLRLGFPIAEIAADGSSILTKPAGTGGAVTAETIVSQLLYEVGGARYAGPDATLRLDSITLTDLGDDRVRMSGVQGEAPPPQVKVSVTEIGGFRQEITVLLTGLDPEAKAELVRTQFDDALAWAGLPVPQSMEWTLARTDHADGAAQEEATARLTLVARDENPKTVGRAFSSLLVEFALGSIPGFFSAGPPGEATVYGRFRPEYVDQSVPGHRVHIGETTVEIAPPQDVRALEPTPLDEHSPAPSGAAATAATTPAPEAAAGDSGMVTLPLGRLFGGRSGDKGGTANVGLWARTDDAWDWLREEITSDRFRELLPEFAGLAIDRVELPNLRALNFVAHDALGEGVAFGARFDPQAKGIAEWLRARHITVPAALAQQTSLDGFFTDGPGAAAPAAASQNGATT